MSGQFQFYSRQFQFTHGNSNFTHSNFNFTHGNFNLLTAISIYSWQFQFYSEQFLHGNAHGIFVSLTTCQLRRPTLAKHQKSKRKIKSRCLKSIFKEKSENHKSKVDLRTSRTIGGTDLHETTDRYGFVSVSIHFFSCVYMGTT